MTTAAAVLSHRAPSDVCNRWGEGGEVRVRRERERAAPVASAYLPADCDLMTAPSLLKRAHEVDEGFIGGRVAR